MTKDRRDGEGDPPGGAGSQDLDSLRRRLREMEIRHRALFESTRDGILLMHGLRFVDCNDRSLTMFECSREQIIGASVLELSPATQPDGESSRELAARKVDLAFREGPQFFEWELCRRHGTPFPAEVSLSALEPGAETLQAVVRDVTERKLIEETLRKNERQISLIYDTVGDIIFKLQLDAEGNYYFASVNRCFLTTTGLNAADIVGKKVQQIIPEPSLTMVLEKYAQAIREKTTVRWEETSSYPSGELTGEVSIAPMFDDGGTCIGLVGSVHDITERKRTQQRLEERVAERTAELAIARDRAEESDRLKSAFLATMSHELRTPLNSIIGFTGILLMGMVGPLTPEQLKQLNMVQDSARHLLDLINDVLDISKIEAGELELAHGPFPMAAAVARSVERVAPLAAKKQLPVRSSVAPEVAEVVGDRRRVEQILINLLGNAVKFTDQGEVRIDCRLEDGVVVTRVSDTGIGIRPEDLPTLFKPFRQLDTGIARQYEGTGLGLHICKRLADAMGATILVESVWGRGTEITLRLPLRKGT